jgi:hypothetical protein
VTSHLTRLAHDHLHVYYCSLCCEDHWEGETYAYSLHYHVTDRGPGRSGLNGAGGYRHDLHRRQESYGSASL